MWALMPAATRLYRHLLAASAAHKFNIGGTRGREERRQMLAERQQKLAEAKEARKAGGKSPKPAAASPIS
ncbi:MAG: hypothetical protein ACPIOQ_65200, partial [Promethearchaeia archaeon]